MKKISCLIVDMGGVLTLDQREDKVAEMMGILSPHIARELFYQSYWKHRFDYDRGLVDGAAYWTRIAGDFDLRLPASSLVDLIRADLASWFNTRQGMIDSLAEMRGRVARLVLLSNIHGDGARYIKSEEGRAWSSLFDELVLSCEHGLLKPEIEIYEAALDAAGVLPGEALFVDDVQVNVDGALRAGMASFRFVGEDDFAARMTHDYELIGDRA